MTATPSFGTGKREGHDASAYYERMESPTLSRDTTLNDVDDSVTGRVWCKSSESMTEVPDNSVALVFTSPPYHVGKDYDTDLPFDEYVEFLGRVFEECHRVLEPGGKLVVNVANLGRKPYIRLNDIVADILTGIGLLSRAEIIWMKGEGSNGSCAWGTWLSAKNPIVRDLHEYVLVFSKGTWGRVRTGESTMSPAEFMEATLSIWRIPPASAKRLGHPAPFPAALAERVINLFTFADDVVLDPFLGSGTTAVAAEGLGRRWIGYELSAEYALLASKRISKAHQPDTNQKETTTP